MTDRLTVSELFYSIQGESTHAGLPCCFIRLNGCNLRCVYCDTPYSWQESGRTMQVDDIITWVKRHCGRLTELTGGEPLLQEGVYQLIDRLLAMDRTVLLETNGSIAITRVPPRVRVILDIKCPGSGMAEETDWHNIHLLKVRKLQGSRDEVKFVLCSEEDFHWARQVVEEHDLTTLVPVLFAPVTDMFPARQLAELILSHQLEARLQLQLHTRLWPDHPRGR